MYPKLKLVISSIPDSRIERSAFFRVYKLAPLTREDLQKILKKLVNDRVKEKSIVDVVRKSTSDIASLLTTPLMVSLLVYFKIYCPSTK